MPDIPVAAASDAGPAAAGNMSTVTQEEKADSEEVINEDTPANAQVASDEAAASHGQPVPPVSFDREHVINYGDIPHEDAKWVVCRDGLLRKIEWTTLASAKGDQVCHSVYNSLTSHWSLTS
jgi:hypothetical protein